MSRLGKLGLAGAAAAVALAFAACGSSERIRVYVEPTYEQDRLQELLASYPEVKVLFQPGTEDVTLRVEAARDERAAGSPRAALRARDRQSGYEVYAVAEFLPVRNARGGRARWVNSYTRGVREDDMAEILIQVVREAAHQEHRDILQRPAPEVDRALLAATPAS